MDDATPKCKQCGKTMRSIATRGKQLGRPTEIANTWTCECGETFKPFEKADLAINADIAYTVKYCDECLRALSPADRSPEATAFINASAFTEGITPRYNGPLIDEEGTCHKCGKKDTVSYYQIL